MARNFFCLILSAIFFVFTLVNIGIAENPVAKEPEKKEVMLEKIESLEVQNLSKDIRLLQLEAQNLLSQRQQALWQRVEELKKKYKLNGNWEINPEGTKFVKMVGGE